MKTDRLTMLGGLDQLFFSPLIGGETTESRKETIEIFLNQNGWTWDQVISDDQKENN